MSKSILVDLSELKNIYCGLGQVALAYGNYFKSNYKKNNGKYTLTLLMPKELFGIFGNEVKYLDSTNWFYKKFRFLIPKFDIWHATHQLSRFKPFHINTKFIITIHDLNYLYETTGGRQRRKHRRLQRKVNRANIITAISHFAKKDTEQHLKLRNKPCEVIYNGVHVIVNDDQSQPNIPVKSPFFFSIGVVNNKKNFHVLLDMMKLMPEKHLYIAGHKDLKYGRMIEERIQNENINNVTLLGLVSAEEKVWLYANCEAFVFPSLFEGFGLPVIEAMQFGKPVFSSRATSLEEIGGKHAYFWESFDPENMKKVIDDNLEAYYADPQLAENAKEYAQSYSYDKHFEAYEKLYTTL